jgi:hypothetical protein
MRAVVSTFFWLFLFPHEGRIVTIALLSLSHPNPSLGASTVPMIDNTHLDIINVRVGLFPSLMVTFDYSPPFSNFKLILVAPNQPRVEIFQISSFRMTYFHDLWTLPSPSASMEGTRHYGMAMPLSAT